MSDENFSNVHDDHARAPELVTERLKLNALVASDAPTLFEYRSHPDVVRYQAWQPGSADDALRLIRSVASESFGAPGAWSQLGVRRRESGTLIGDLGIHCPADDPRQAEIGFTLAPRHQGEGFASEAVAALLVHLFGAMQKHRAFASVDPRNKASIALLERIGMRKEAHFRESLWFKGEWVDDVVFGMLASEWKD